MAWPTPFKTAVLALGLMVASNSMAADKGLLDAVRAGQLAQVEQLLAKGADLDTRAIDGSTPLLLATQANRVDIARALIEAGADVNR